MPILMLMRRRARRMAAGVTLAGWLAAPPALAQTENAPVAHVRVINAARVTAGVAGRAPATPLADAGRALAVAGRDEVPGGQAPPTTTPARACVQNVVVGGLLGAGAGAGFVWIAAADGTESAAGVIKTVAVAGFVLGALVGALTCAL